jgi:hypothetical protein
MARSAHRMSQVLVDTPAKAADFSMASFSVALLGKSHQGQQLLQANSFR